MIIQMLEQVAEHAEFAVKGYRYLKRFGYLPEDGTPKLESLYGIITHAQQILGIQQTGMLDEVTSKAMEFVPRCGCSDIAFFTENAAALNQWLKSKAQTGLSYHLMNYSKLLSTQEQEDAISKAFTSWETRSRVRFFRKKSTDADILISFSSRRDEEFGTAGNVLAWAELPQGSSSTRQLINKIDTSENWTPKFLEVVEKHEIGHLLGIDHTRVPKQLMNPMLQRDIDDLQREYDIPQVEMRYDAWEVPPVPLPPEADPFRDTVVTHQGKRYKFVLMG
jgi:hypothetical protein